jgi:hypothetical protein
MTQGQFWLVIALTAAPSAAIAQGPRVYVGASFGSHAERSDQVRDTAPAAAAVAGVQLTNSWSGEVEFGRPTRSFLRERTCRCFSFATSVADFDRLAVTELLREEREVMSTLSVAAVYEPNLGGRWRPRLLVGGTLHRTRESQSSTILSVPEGIDPTRAAAARPPYSTVRNLGGPTFGGGVSYRVTPRIAVGGDLRYDYGSFGDEINNVWRTSVRSVWLF